MPRWFLLFCKVYKGFRCYNKKANSGCVIRKTA